jgi:hypothetical protein
VLSAYQGAFDVARKTRKLATYYNSAAWQIATRLAGGDDELLERALVYALRACTITNRQKPDYLDTLAEVQFRRGNRFEALAIIDEALALGTGDDEHYREQRERFLGE